MRECFSKVVGIRDFHIHVLARSAGVNLIGVGKSNLKQLFGFRNGPVLEELVFTLFELVLLTIVDQDCCFVDDGHVSEVLLGVEEIVRDRAEHKYEEENYHVHVAALVLRFYLIA